MFKFRKIASVLVSAVMVSSTVALAAAANFPAPFVSNGSGNVAIVYGSAQVGGTDLLAAADISSALSAQLTTQTATGSSSSTISGGDYVKLAKGSQNLNLGDSLFTVFGSRVTADDLKVLLGDGVYKDKSNTEYKYTQEITVPTGLTLNYFKDSDFNNNNPTVGINLASGAAVMNYTLDFVTNVQSDVSAAGRLTDIETTDLNILGKDYYVLQAQNGTSLTSAKLILLDTANSAIIGENEKQSITVGGKNYDVSLVFINADKVEFSVNGEVTNSLAIGGTDKLSDGTYIGVKDILSQDYAGGVKKVQFSLGTGKLELTNGQTIKLNDKTVNEITSYIVKSTPSGSKETIDKIVLQWKTDDKAFIAPTSELVMPGFNAVKFSMGNFTQPSEVTTVEDGSSNYMQLKTTIKNGDVTIPFLYANSSGEFTAIGKATDELLTTSPSNNILFNYTRGDRYMVASWNNTRDSETYYLKFGSFTDPDSNGINKTTPQRLVDGSWEDLAQKGTGDTLTIGSLTLTFNRVTKADKTVNITASSGGSFNTVYTKGGLEIALPYDVSTAGTQTADGAINFTNANATYTTVGHNSDSWYMFFTEMDKDGNLGAGGKFNVTLNDKSDGSLEVSSIDTGKSTLTFPDDSNHKIQKVVSDLATQVEQLGDSNSQRTAQITYAGTQSYADVFLTSLGGTVTSSGSGSTTTLGNPMIKDSEVASAAGKNLIVVGGSCVNTVAAQLLGSATPLCGADFTAKTGIASGQFLIQTFDRTGGKVATLVAGYNAQDTTNAATYLKTATVDTTVGKKYVGTSATSATLQTTSA